MKISHEEKIERFEEVIDDVLCNKCGKSMQISNYEYESEGTRLFADFGYGSNKDGLMEEFHLCDDCYDQFIALFKHAPTEI